MKKACCKTALGVGLRALPLPGLLGCLLLLAACGENIKKREDDFASVRERHRQLLEQRQSAQTRRAQAKRIEVAGDEAWMYETYLATYRNQGLRETLKRLAPGYPVAYALPPDYNPAVSSTPGAVTVEDHLNAAALQANVGYEFHQGVLLVTPMTTKKYEIPLYGGGSNAIKVGSDNLGQGRDAGNFENALSSELSAENDVHQLVNTVLGIRYCDQDGEEKQDATDELAAYTHNDRECYSISPTGNLLSITARPHRVVLFDAAYKKWLAAVTRQANIKITTIRLDVTDLAQQKIDLALARNARIAANISNISGDLVGLSAGGGALSIKVDDPDDAFNTTQIVLKALSKIGNVSIDDSREVLVYNNRLVTLRNYNVHRFVEKTSVQQTNAGGTSLSTPTIEIGELETGLVVNILPTLTQDLIALRVVINEAKIDSFDPYEIAGTSGVLPNNSGSDNVFDVTMEDGETVLLASTYREEIEVKADRSGLLPVWPLNQLNSNAASGRKRLMQTLFLIQGSFKS